MNVTIHGRHFNVSNSLKNAIEEKLEKIRYFYDHVLRFNIFLEKEKLNYKADISFFAGGKEFYLQVKAPTISEAIDKMIDKLERQVRKHKERMQAYSRERVSTEGAPSSVAASYSEITESPMSELEAVIKLSNSEQESLVFFPVDDSRTAMVVSQASEDLFILYGCDPEDKRWYCKTLYLVNEEIDQTRIDDYLPESLSDEQAISRIEQSEATVFIFESPSSKKVQAVIREGVGYTILVLEK